MKRALILLTGFMLMLHAKHAYALPPALSPYVQETIERSDRGLQIANDRSGWMFFVEDALPLWLRNITSSISGLVDTRILIVAQQKSLLESTTCRRYDDLLLELQIAKTQSALREAIDEGSASKILALQPVLDFLQQRQRVLETGAVDPSVTDPSWYAHWTFDTNRPVYCGLRTEGVCVEMSNFECLINGGQPADSLQACYAYGFELPGGTFPEPQMCPFSSDYLPPSLGGFGCDAETLRDLQNRAQGDEFNRFQEVLEPELTALQSIQLAVVGSGNERIHQKIDGCPAPVDLTTLQEKAVFTPLRGPFSLNVNHLQLLMQFQDVRNAQALQRPAPPYLTEQGMSPLVQGITAPEIEKVKDFSLAQAVEESRMFAEGADPLLTANVSFGKLSNAVQELGQLASSMTGLRGFVRDFAYFLRRTCIDRPCNERLERILRIVFTDTCFPYATGEYEQDTPDNPRWQRCADAAGFPLP